MGRIVKLEAVGTRNDLRDSPICDDNPKLILNPGDNVHDIVTTCRHCIAEQSRHTQEDLKGFRQEMDRNHGQILHSSRECIKESMRSVEDTLYSKLAALIEIV